MKYWIAFVKDASGISQHQHKSKKNPHRHRWPEKFNNPWLITAQQSFRAAADEQSKVKAESVRIRIGKVHLAFCIASKKHTAQQNILNMKCNEARYAMFYAPALDLLFPF